MRHLLAFSVKLFSTFIVLGFILGLIYNFGFAEVLLITAVLSMLGYVVGDLFILPKTNNMTASAADLGLAFLVIWFMGSNLAFIDNLFSVTLLGAIGITVFEALYHPFVRDTNPVETGYQQRQRLRHDFLTELSEELRPVKPDVRSPKDHE